MNAQIMIFFVLIVPVLTIAENAKGPEGVVDRKTLEEWGYRIVSSGVIEQADWEKKRFGGCKKYYQKIKAVKEVPGWSKAYYRFTLVREVFPSQEQAVARLTGLHLLPPDGDDKKDADILLRKGFRVGNVVYHVSTDVNKFYLEELPRLFKLFRSSFLPNSER